MRNISDGIDQVSKYGTYTDWILTKYETYMSLIFDPYLNKYVLFHSYMRPYGTNIEHNTAQSHVYVPRFMGMSIPSRVSP